MKKTLLLLSAALTLGLNAQIVHTDLMPDSIYASKYAAYIDMDNDNNDDFHIVGDAIAGPPATEFNIVQTGGVGSLNFVMVTGGDLSVLAYGTPINSTSTTWHQLTATNPIMSTFLSGSSIGGLWSAQTSQYIGVQFMIGANAHFGWIEVSTKGSGNKIAIQAYAYNTTANQTITAGQTVILTTGLQEQEVASIRVYPNPVQGVLQVSSPASQIQSWTMVDVTGKVVLSEINIAKKNAVINMAHLERGIYFVRFTTANGQEFTKKVIKA